MKKQSLYARKRDLQERAEAFARAEASLRGKIAADVAALQLSAGLHAWTGNDGAVMVNKAGRLCYVVAYAANQAGIDTDCLDVRILRGMAGSLADLAADLENIDRHRVGIQSGLQAIGRLLPHCDDLVLLAGAASLEARLASSSGMGTADVDEALGAGSTHGGERLAT